MTQYHTVIFFIGLVVSTLSQLWEVRGPNTGPTTDYSAVFFLSLCPSLHVSVGILPSNIPKHLHPTSFPINLLFSSVQLCNSMSLSVGKKDLNRMCQF